MAFSIPASRIPDPSTAPSLNWGIIGPGRIADEFVNSVFQHTQQKFVAVGSRSKQRSEEFAEKWNIANAYGSYEEVAQDPAVDVVYIATPHAFHREQAEICLNAGKHVLIEKPMTVSAEDARAIASLAQEKGLFAMEALWWRFLPSADVISRLLENGTLGEIEFLRSDLGEYFEKDDERMFNPALGGGSLLDLGVYLVTLTEFYLGANTAVGTVSGTRTETGVSNSVAMTLRSNENSNAGIAQLYTTMDTWTPSDAYIHGKNARLIMHAPIYAVPKITLTSLDGSDVVTAEFAQTDWASGMCYEAAAVARAISEGRTEHEIRPLSSSVKTLELLDTLEAKL